jgi:hypothetical protein
MPFGRARKKKEVAQGVALPPEPDAMFNGMPIPPDYAKVTIAWICPGFKQEEIDFPAESGETFLSTTIALEVLWNKADLILEAPTPASQPSLSSSSPAGDPDDDDDDDGGGDDRGGNDNDNAGGPSTSTQTNPSPGNDNPQGGTGAPSGESTPPPSSNQGSNECPPPPRKPDNEEEAIPPNFTKTSWLAFQKANRHPISTVFERYATSKHSQYMRFYLPFPLANIRSFPRVASRLHRLWFGPGRIIAPKTMSMESSC